MNSNRSLRANVIEAVLFAAALAAVAGCQNSDGPHNTEFFGQQENQSVTTTLDRQIANGARNDAMLREQHFDGSRLNALGRWKLDRMLAQAGPVTLYLPGSTDKSSFDARKQAVVAYAKDGGRGEADVTVLDGINPATAHPAAPDLARLSKTELGKADGQGSTAADVTGNSNGLGLSGNNSPGSMGSTAKSGG